MATKAAQQASAQALTLKGHTQTKCPSDSGGALMHK